MSASNNSRNKNRRQHHVFLFRHCVRSLPSTIDFYHDESANSVVGGDDGDESSENGGNVTSSSTTTKMTTTTTTTTTTLYSTNPLDYLPNNWPQWDTPPQWCTSTGSDIMKGTGRFLFHQYLTSTTINNHWEGTTTTTKTTAQQNIRRRVKFLSDSSPRDVQTALAMISGISEEEEMEMEQFHLQQTQHQQQQPTMQQYPPLQGLNNIQLDTALFNHFDNDPQQQLDDDICTVPPKIDTIRAITKRLASIPPPGKLVDIMEWMEQKTGNVDLFQAFFDDDDENRVDRNQIVLTPSGDHFQGAWNLVKYIAQSITYSRASGNVNDINTNITIAEYYNLMAWEHWSRHILDVGNNLSAARGGIMMVRILQELRMMDARTNDDADDYIDGNDDDMFEEEEDGEDADEEVEATFIIGHDGDIDALATALGISWNLPPPYHPGYTATPPGSAVHFVYDVDQGHVEISVMAPMFFSNGDDDRGGEGGGVEGINYLNASGILVEVPVEFVDPLGTKSRGGSTTAAANAAVFPSLDVLRNHTLNTLRGYSGSAECFEAAETLTAPDLLLLPHRGSTTIPDHTGSTMLLIGGLLGFAMSALVLHCVHRKRYNPTSTKQHRGTYAGMPLPKDVEFS